MNRLYADWRAYRRRPAWPDPLYRASCIGMWLCVGCLAFFEGWTWLWLWTQAPGNAAGLSYAAEVMALTLALASVIPLVVSWLWKPYLAFTWRAHLPAAPLLLNSVALGAAFCACSQVWLLAPETATGRKSVLLVGGVALILILATSASYSALRQRILPSSSAE